MLCAKCGMIQISGRGMGNPRWLAGDGIDGGKCACRGFGHGGSHAGTHIRENLFQIEINDLEFSARKFTIHENLKDICTPDYYNFESKYYMSYVNILFNCILPSGHFQRNKVAEGSVSNISHFLGSANRRSTYYGIHPSA